MSSSSLFTPLIQYNDQYQIAVCTDPDCHIGLGRKNLKRHLTGKLHLFKKDQWGPILDSLNDKSLPEYNADFPHPSNGHPPVPHLRIMNGYECDICGWVRISRHTMKYTRVSMRVRARIRARDLAKNQSIRSALDRNLRVYRGIDAI